MRKYQHQQILEILSTLEEAIDAMRQFFSQKEYEAVIQLLADSQDCAVQIGTYIEQIVGQGTGAVSLLSTYCEILYQISLEMTKEDGASSSSFKRLRKQLIEIENCVKTKLKPDRIEVVFLPYKASMWDSMESIWLAAKDDPQCDAYVVPIPYYDKLPSGRLGNMHNEGNSYPDYVPVTDWQDYDLEARHPDAVFIHNPYDDQNIATSVHPDYYSERLRECTDLLCYIPYFVCLRDVQDYFCTLPGVLYSDHTFVQSERVRSTYIRQLKEFEEANDCKGAFGSLEDKILALGSPKFDKVLRTQREDADIPDEWRKLIQKSDGSKKKIILYNLSIASALNGDRQYLQKLRYVMEQFQNRDDVVLWWRPHPLSQATYHTMREELLAEYQQIVAEYKVQGYGIYDDTPDLDRAIAASDAYFGDRSSIVIMYALSGKPAVLQDVIVKGLENDPNRMIYPQYLSADAQGAVWIMLRMSTSVLKIDEKNGDVLDVVSFSEMQKGFTRNFSCMEAVGEYLVFFPQNHDSIVLYHTLSRQTKVLHIDNAYMDVKGRRRHCTGVVTAFVHKNRLFAFGRRLSALLEVDIEHQSILYHEGLYEAIALGQSPPASVDILIKSCYCDQETGTVLFPVVRGQTVIELDLSTMQWAKHTIPMQGQAGGFSLVARLSDDWLLLSDVPNAFRWNRETGQIAQIGVDYFKNKNNSDFVFQVVINCSSYLLAFPKIGKVMRIDADTAEISEAPDFSGLVDMQYRGVIRSGAYIYWLHQDTRVIYRYHIEQGSIETVLPRISERQLRTIIENEISIMDESRFCTMRERFLHGGVLAYYTQFGERKELAKRQRRHIVQSIESGDGTSGRKIYEYVRNEVFHR